MSILKKNRGESKFYVAEFAHQLRRKITDVILRDFGYSVKKAEQLLLKEVGAKSFEEMTDAQRAQYEKTKQLHESFESWFIPFQRITIMKAMQDMTAEIYMANSIWPESLDEYYERRIRQEFAIGYAYKLVQELQYTMEELPADMNKYFDVSGDIKTEISLIRNWRKSDKRTFKHVFDGVKNSNSNISSNPNTTDSSSYRPYQNMNHQTGSFNYQNPTPTPAPQSSNNFNGGSKFYQPKSR